MKGTRYINGQEYLLAGRVCDKFDAKVAKVDLLREWEKVRIIKIHDWDFMLYVHGRLAD